MADVPTHEFKVKMTCESCSNAVKKVLGKVQDKVEDVHINLNEQVVKVKTSLTPDEVLQIIKKTGKETEYISSS